MLHSFALQRGTGVAFRLRRVSVGSGKLCNQVSRIKRRGSPLFTVTAIAKIHSHFSTWPGQTPSLAQTNWRWMATSLHTCGSGLRGQSPSGYAHIWPALWSICHRLQIHLAVSLSDHQHCVWMCYSPPKTQAQCLLDLPLLKNALKTVDSIQCIQDWLCIYQKLFIGVRRVLSP